MYKRKFVNELYLKIQAFQKEQGDWERALGLTLKENPLIFTLYKGLKYPSWEYIDSWSEVKAFLRVIDKVTDCELTYLNLSAHEIMLILEEAEDV